LYDHWYMTKKAQSFAPFLLRLRTKPATVTEILQRRRPDQRGLRPIKEQWKKRLAGENPMLSLRDVIDFASMSEDLSRELTRQNVGLPDLGALVASYSGVAAGPVSNCNEAPCAANDVDGE